MKSLLGLAILFTSLRYWPDIFRTLFFRFNQLRGSPSPPGSVKMADANKTEQATPKRREKAREDGQVTRSRELPSVLAITGAIGTLFLVSQGAVSHWTTFYENMLSAATEGDFQSNGPLFFWSSIEVLRWTLPVLSAALVLSVGAGLAQGGFNIAPGRHEVEKFERFQSRTASLGRSSPSAGSATCSSRCFLSAPSLGLEKPSLREHWGVMVQASSFGIRSLSSIIGSMIFEVGWKSLIRPSRLGGRGLPLHVEEDGRRSEDDEGRSQRREQAKRWKSG